PVTITADLNLPGVFIAAYLSWNNKVIASGSNVGSLTLGPVTENMAGVEDVIIVIVTPSGCGEHHISIICKDCGPVLGACCFGGEAGAKQCIETTKQECDQLKGQFFVGKK